MTESVIAPLGAGDYQLRKLVFEVGDSAGEYNRRELSLGLSHQFGTNAEDPNAFMLSLTLGINVDDDVFTERGFKVEATAAAAFHVESGAIPEDDVVGYVLINGLSLLYSGLRHEVMTVTGQSAVGRVTIPTVNMVEYLKSQQAEDASAESPVAAEDATV